MRGLLIGLLAVLAASFLSLAVAQEASRDPGRQWSPWPSGGQGTSKTETLEDVARSLAQRAPSRARVALAVALTEAGHWRLMNAAGEPFTAATSSELETGLKALVPQNAGGFDAVDFVLPLAHVFGNAEALARLPGKAGLYAADGAVMRRLFRPAQAGSTRWRIEVSDGLQLEVGSQGEFEEVQRLLVRPILREQVRVLSIAQGGPTSVSRRPSVDPVRRVAQPDAIDPEHFSAAFGMLGGQIVLVAGRVQGDRLAYTDINGRTGTVPLAALETYAASRDVDLFVVSTSSGRQPGSRNLLYQQVVLGGLEKAISVGTLAPFLRAIAGDPPVLAVIAERAGANRLRLRIEPEASSNTPTGSWSQTISGAIKDLLPETTGTLATTELQVSLVGSQRHSELSWRLVPYLPITWLWALSAFALTCIAGIGTAWRWWDGIWPPEARDEYGSTIGHLLAQAFRLMIFIIFFLPLAGLPAVVRRVFALASRRRVGAVS